MLKPVLFCLTLLLILYLLTLQSIPNGSSDPYMIDVGETQVALNVWGTLHATGYPLYTILGNAFTPLAKGTGFNPAEAAGVFSTLWTLLALGALYALMVRWKVNPWLAGAGVFWLGLARSIWIHSVIAEVYSMALLILVGMWIITLWPGNWSLRNRVWALALLWGIGIAHHRALAFPALGVLLPLLPDLWQERRRLPLIIAGAVPLGLLGFLPYAYLPLRANAGADWVYSEDVNTWDGFWYHFWGREANYLITTPKNLQGWLDNLEGTLGILSREITPPGLIIALICLVIACWKSPARGMAWTTTLSGFSFFLFAVAYHKAVLPEAILMMALPSLAVGVVLAFDWLVRYRKNGYMFGTVLLLGWGLLLIPFHLNTLQELTEDETGLEAIASAKGVPRDDPHAALMLSWGPRYFAASYARLVTQELAELRMVDHTANFRAMAEAGDVFYTQPDTLYGYPVSWWSERIGEIYLTAPAPNLVKLSPRPELAPERDPTTMVRAIEGGIYLSHLALQCDEETVMVHIEWYAQQQPDRNLSVKVHLVPEDSEQPLAFADASAPVYGWRPTSTWQAGEVIQDYYRLDRAEGGERVIVGMYEQLPDGSFQNYGDAPISLGFCEPLEGRD